MIDVFLPAFTPVLAALTALFNCETFTASVSASPAATPVIFLLPALTPASLSIEIGPTSTWSKLTLLLVEIVNSLPF